MGFEFGLIGFLGPIFITVIFTIIVCIFIYAIVSGISQYLKNEASPILTLDAKVVAKRVDVSHSSSNHNDAHSSSHSSTTYYVTFQFESNNRIEFVTKGKDYGLLVENDTGKLTFQGTRFLGFIRN